MKADFQQRFNPKFITIFRQWCYNQYPHKKLFKADVVNFIEITLIFYVTEKKIDFDASWPSFVVNFEHDLKKDLADFIQGCENVRRQ